METKEQKIERLKRNLKDYKRLLRNDIIKKYDELISYLEMRVEQLEQELKELENDGRNSKN